MDIVITNEKKEHNFCIENLAIKVFGAARFTKAAHFIREGGEHDLNYSLVALLKDQIVGSVRLSPVTVNNLKAFLLGPVMVDPFYQGKAIGSALVTRSLEQSSTTDRDCAILIGDEAYYRRFGFQKINSKNIYWPAPCDLKRCLYYPYNSYKPLTFDGYVRYGY